MADKIQNPVFDTRPIQYVQMVGPDGTKMAVGSQGNLPITVNTIEQVTVVDHSGTIASGSVAQTALAANAARKYLILQNTDPTNILWYNFTTTAVQTQPSLQLLPGQALVQDTVVSVELISVIGPSTGQLFSAKDA